MTTTIPAKPRGYQSVVDYIGEAEAFSNHLESTVTETPVSQDEALRAAICVHHWIIEPAFRPTSKGVCKHCGEEREFDNYWDEDAAKERSNFLLNYKRWDSLYERDRDEEFVRGLRQYGNQGY